MKYYELTYTISQNLSDEEKNSLAERVISWLPNPPAGRENKLTVRPQHFLVSLEFYSPPEKIEELEKNLRSESYILRYIILTKSPKKEEEPKKLKIKKHFFAPPLKSEPTSPKKPMAEEKKVELEEIDKKLEEILKE